MKKIRKVLFLSLIISLLITTPVSAEETPNSTVFSGLLKETENSTEDTEEVEQTEINEEPKFNDTIHVLDTIQFFTEDEINTINDFSFEISEVKNTTICVLVTSTEETKDDIGGYASKYLNENMDINTSYLIVIDPINRKLSIGSTLLFSVDTNDVIEQYSRKDFSNDDFYSGIMNTMSGIVGGYVSTKESNSATSQKGYNDVPYIKLESYITDLAGLLSESDIEKIQANAYKIKNNYDCNIYFVIAGDISEYDQDDYAQKVFDDNFDSLSDDILIFMSFENQSFNYVSGTYVSDIDPASVYSKYAKSYFHLEEPDYTNGIIKFQNAIVAEYKGILIEEVEGKTMSGTRVNGSSIDSESIKNILKIVLLIAFIGLICLIALVIIKKCLIDTEKLKGDLINEHPDIAFDKLKKAISIDKDEFIDYKIKESQLNSDIDELYDDVSEEISNKIAKEDTTIDQNNIFDQRNNNVNLEDETSDIVISSINDMIIDIVKTCEGTKEYYNQLQEALNIYNSLSFSNKMKLDRSYTSQLEALARKSKMDKITSERKSSM